MSKKDQIMEEEIPQEPDAGPSSFFPEPGPGLGKEVKIGLAVILGLLIVFGVVVVKKMRRAPEPPAMAEGPGAKPGDRPDDKHGPKDPAPGGPASKAAPTTFVAGRPTTTTLPASSPKWNSVDNVASPKSPLNDNRLGAAPPPSYMPNPPGVAGSPDRFARSTNPLEKAAPPRPDAPVGRKAVGSDDPPFDPFGKGTTPSGLGQSAPMVPVSAPAGRPGSAMATEGMGRPDRSQGYPAGSPGASIAMRDISDMGSGAGVRNTMSPPNAGISSVGEPRVNSLRVSPADNSVPPPMPSYGSSAPGMHRPSPEPPPTHAPAASPAFGRVEPPLGPRPSESGGRRPDGTYVVQPSDNFWTISQRLYGTNAYFRALAEHNRAKFPEEDRLTVGDVILAPSAADLERNYPSLCPKPENRHPFPERSIVSSASSRGPGARVYVVQEGDNLFNIAKYELNAAARWVEIYELNRDLLGDQVDRLKPGMRLVLPDGPSPMPRTATQAPNVRR